MSPAWAAFAPPLHAKGHIDCHISFKCGVLLSRVPKSAFSFHCLWAHFGAKLKCFQCYLIANKVTLTPRSQDVNFGHPIFCKHTFPLHPREGCIFLSMSGGSSPRGDPWCSGPEIWGTIVLNTGKLASLISKFIHISIHFI